MLRSVGAGVDTLPRKPHSSHLVLAPTPQLSEKWQVVTCGTPLVLLALQSVGLRVGWMGGVVSRMRADSRQSAVCTGQKQAALGSLPSCAAHNTGHHMTHSHLSPRCSRAPLGLVEGVVTGKDHVMGPSARRVGQIRAARDRGDSKLKVGLVERQGRIDRGLAAQDGAGGMG